jgi:DtxR family Mn-dependent transcriptional regulator
MPDETGLTASLEDYLEAIFCITSEKQAARAKDIADRLEVNNSSVTGALRSLADKGLVNYSPYDIVTLTPKGMSLAEDVVRRHETLRHFFTRVLALSDADAEEAACKMEHAVTSPILQRFTEFVRFLELCPVCRARWSKGTGYRCQHVTGGEASSPCQKCISLCADGKGGPVVLGTVEAGRKVRIVALKAGRRLEARLAAMGLLPGTEVQIVANPSNGPSILAIRNTRLVVGRGMTDKILVV